MEAWASLLVSTATLLTAVAGVAMGVLNRNKINDVHISINSRMDQLLQARGDAAHAEGLAEGKAVTLPALDTGLPPSPDGRSAT